MHNRHILETSSQGEFSYFLEKGSTCIYLHIAPNHRPTFSRIDFSRNLQPHFFNFRKERETRESTAEFRAHQPVLTARSAARSALDCRAGPRALINMEGSAFEASRGAHPSLLPTIPATLRPSLPSKKLLHSPVSFIQAETLSLTLPSKKILFLFPLAYPFFQKKTLLFLFIQA